MKTSVSEPGIGSPPVGDTVRRRQRIEDDLGPGLDPAHQSEAGHRLPFLGSVSLRSA